MQVARYVSLSNFAIIFLLAALYFPVICLSQGNYHVNAHAHNDYEHTRPLQDALHNGFISVEADVHLRKGKLVVAHNKATRRSPLLSELYLKPLDSILRHNQGAVYSTDNPFFLMIDIKTDGETTYRSLQKELSLYPSLLCNDNACGVKIFLSGNRPTELVVKNGCKEMSIDGRPGDVGKGYTRQCMPVISDHYKNWTSWQGKSELSENDLSRIRALADQVHAEGRKLRLWAIPDNEIVWEALLEAGVDLINTDKLSELSTYLKSKGL